MAEQITNYKCPACTGPLHFAGASGKMECEYCGSIYSVDEIENMYESENVKAEAAMAAAEEKAANREKDEWSGSEEWVDEGMKAYNCPSCGAGLVCEETLAASSCPYCGNPTVVPGQFSGMLKPEFVIPFKYEKQQAVEALKKHYGGRYLLPKTFTSGNHLEEVKGVYVPFWLYDGVADGDCSYEGIKEKKTRSGDTEVITKDYYDVSRRGNLVFEKVPADASKAMPDDLMDSIEPYEYADLKPFAKAYLTGYLADRYDVSAQEDQPRVIERASTSMKEILKDDVKGYTSVNTRIENVQVDVKKTHYAMMPVWLLSTKWENKNFLFAMNGQTGKMVGDLPIDAGKLWGTIIGILAVIAALGIFVINMSPMTAIIIAVIAAGIWGLVASSSMKSVASARSANTYISKDAVKITYRNDQHTRTTTDRRKISK